MNTKEPKSAAERKAAERARRRAAGQVLIQEWVDKELVPQIKNYIAKLRKLKNE